MPGKMDVKVDGWLNAWMHDERIDGSKNNRK